MNKTANIIHQLTEVSNTFFYAVAGNLISESFLLTQYILETPRHSPGIESQAT